MRVLPAAIVATAGGNGGAGGGGAAVQVRHLLPIVSYCFPLFRVQIALIF